MPLLVRYLPPDGQEPDLRFLREGETLVIGRNPGETEMKLPGIDRGVSRRAFELTLRGGEDVYIGNKNRTPLVIQYGYEGLAGSDLRNGEGHQISGAGWILIRETHQINFEIIEPTDNPDDPPPDGETTLNDLAWRELHENYKDVCKALSTAWIMPDVANIARQTVPTDMQVAILLCFTSTRSPRAARRLASQKIERTKLAVGNALGREFRGPGGKTELAQWAETFVCPGDIEALCGWPNFQ